VFQMWLRATQAAVDSGHEQKRFSTAERRGELRVVASPDARRGSLRLDRNAVLYSAMIEPGRHVVHELSRGRSAWLHIVQGEATLGDLVLTTGDGVGLTAERAISFTARVQTEVLLVDLDDRA
jgi:quercetin 2,3-dioxygenase